MANLTGMYNPNAEASVAFDALPSGEYLAIISGSEMKTTKNGSGEYLELEHTVIDGPCKGRKTWARLNLKNANAQAVEIANRDFAAIRAAVDVAQANDSVQLHNIPHIIRVEFIPVGTMQKNGPTTKDGNEIKAWKRVDGAVVQTAAAPAAAAPATSPWGQRAA